MSICKKVQSATHFRSPAKISCWKTHRKTGLQDSPSGKKNADGSPKQVNKCVPK